MGILQGMYRKNEERVAILTVREEKKERKLNESVQLPRDSGHYVSLSDRYSRGKSREKRERCGKENTVGL